MIEAQIEWQGEMRLNGRAASGHNVLMDSAPELGGKNSGFRPKELVLEGLAGCSAMDVLSILKKMHALPEAFRIEVSAEQTEEHPRVFTTIHLKYFVKGEVPESKLKRAIELSQETYCGVSAMLAKTATITWEYIYE